MISISILSYSVLISFSWYYIFLITNLEAALLYAYFILSTESYSLYLLSVIFEVGHIITFL